MKKETLEEVCCTPIGQIKRYVDCKGCDRKPKQERSYSEDEVFAMLLIKHDGLTPEYVLEQFKKKLR